MAAILPRVYPQMLDEVHAPPGRRPRRPSSSAPPATASSATWRTCSAWTAASAPATRSTAEGAFTGRFDGPFVYGPGKVEAMEAFAAAHDIDLAAVLRLLGLALGPADAARPSATRSSSTRTRRWRRSPSARAGRRCASSASAGAWRSAPRRCSPPPSAGAAHATPRGAPRLPPWRRTPSSGPSTPSARPSSRRCPGIRSSRSTTRATSAATPRRGSAPPASTRSPAAPIPRCTGAGSGRCASSPASAPSRRPTSASTTCSTTARPGSRPPSTCRP